MPVTATDIQFFLSGGATNADPNASLGGAISNTAITSGSLNNLFDDVSGAEASAGRTEYRCLYVKNASPTSNLVANITAWVEGATATSNTVASGAVIDIGFNPTVGVGDGTTTGVASTVANETTAPTGVTFSSATQGAPLSLPAPINAGQVLAIWIRRTVPAGASAANDSATLMVKGDSGP